MRTNFFDTMERVTGIVVDEQKKILEEVKANQARLQDCSRHNFQSADSENLIPRKFICANCQGTVDWHAMHWYNKGLHDATNDIIKGEKA